MNHYDICKLTSVNIAQNEIWNIEHCIIELSQNQMIFYWVIAKNFQSDKSDKVRENSLEYFEKCNWFLAETTWRVDIDKNCLD